MSLGDMFNIRDESNIERLVGTINDPQATTGDVLTVQSDKSIKAAPGGSQPVDRSQINGDAVLVANGTTELLPWNTRVHGVDLLDLTDPFNPVIVEAGVYAVSAILGPNDAMTPGGAYRAWLELDQTNSEGDPTFKSSMTVSAHLLYPSLCLSGTYYIEAGGVINLTVENDDGTSDINFQMALGVIQRISGPEA